MYRILIAEDEKVLRGVLESFFSKNGFEKFIEEAVK
jgi:DNA-binding response OmpR family regulator